jgi:tRNA(fMet)-specific endonuclease VapC
MLAFSAEPESRNLRTALMLKYMLDTNIVIYTMKNKPQHVQERFRKHDGQLYISSVARMELV